MLDRGYDQAPAAGAVERHVVGLGTTGGKDYIFGAGANHGRDPVARRLHRIARVTSELMHRRRVSRYRQCLGDCLADFRFDGRRGVVIEINCFRAAIAPAHSAATVD